MIINIQNIQRASQLSPEIPAGIVRTGAYTTQLDAEYFKDRMKQALCTAVITVDRTARGVCVCSASMIPDSCVIDVICIEEGFRGKGLGRKLMAHSLRAMRSLKIRTAFLWVNENNAQAVSFFTGFGFLPDGKRRASHNSMSGEELRYKIDII